MDALLVVILPQLDARAMGSASTRTAWHATAPRQATDTTRGLFASMEPHVSAALAALDAAEAAERHAPPFVITEQYARDIAAISALPQNQNGADKSWVWPAYRFCRRHFQSARLQ